MAYTYGLTTETAANTSTYMHKYTCILQHQSIIAGGMGVEAGAFRRVHVQLSYWLNPNNRYNPPFKHMKEQLSEQFRHFSRLVLKKRKTKKTD